MVKLMDQAEPAQQEGRLNAKALRRRVDKLLNAARERCDQPTSN
jgi:hypothetical protein